jgi:hypothetical protein
LLVGVKGYICNFAVSGAISLYEAPPPTPPLGGGAFRCETFPGNFVAQSPRGSAKGWASVFCEPILSLF